MPKYTDDDLQVAIEAAYRSGVFEERRRVLAAYGQLKETWVPRAVRTYEEVVAERAALMAVSAIDVNRRRGRPDGYVYPGGPVDWATGDPA